MGGKMEPGGACSKEDSLSTQLVHSMVGKEPPTSPASHRTATWAMHGHYHNCNSAHSHLCVPPTHP